MQPFGSATTPERGRAEREAPGRCKALARLGPWPRRSYRALRDYGLGEAEVAGYLGVSPSALRRCVGRCLEPGGGAGADEAARGRRPR